MIEPKHTIVIGGVERRLRFRLSDWARAEMSEGRELRTSIGIPSARSSAILEATLLFVGLRHEMPDLTLDKAFDFLDFENEDTVAEACLRAIYDYEPKALERVKAAQTAMEASKEPLPLEAQQFFDLIQRITTTESGDSAATIATSQPSKSKTLRRVG